MFPADFFGRPEVLRGSRRWPRFVEWYLFLVVTAREALVRGRVLVGGRPLVEDDLDIAHINEIEPAFIHYCLTTGLLLQEEPDGPWIIARWNTWHRYPSQSKEANAERQRDHRERLKSEQATPAHQSVTKGHNWSQIPCDTQNAVTQSNGVTTQPNHQPIQQPIRSSTSSEPQPAPEPVRSAWPSKSEPVARVDEDEDDAGIRFDALEQARRTLFPLEARGRISAPIRAEHQSWVLSAISQKIGNTAVTQADCDEALKWGARNMRPNLATFGSPLSVLIKSEAPKLLERCVKWRAHCEFNASRGHPPPPAPWEQPAAAPAPERKEDRRVS